MTSPRTVVIAGAGIGGLTAAIALAQRGFRVSVIEQAERLEEIGAGIQLSPNASRVLIDLGLGERLAPHVVAPEALKVLNARTGRVLARAPLGAAAAQALRRALLGHSSRRPACGAARSRRGHAAGIDCSSACGSTISPSTATASPSAAREGRQPTETHGDALIGADGLWSALRGRLGHRDAAALRAPHRLARAGAGGRGVAGAARACRQSLARPPCASRPLPGQGRQPRSTWSRSCATTGASRAGARLATATRSWRAFPPACGTRRRAN